jgi:2-keto-3-deoxy-L-rhamnonate aldolase RhmA
MKALDPGQRSIGCWCQIAHPAIAEILARAGFDWIAADCEHGEFETGDIGPFVRAVRQFDCTPLVRVRENATLPIRRALDLGAAGVIVPLVHTPEDARRAVRAAQYPPEGVRGFAWHRANNWGVDFDSYARDFEPMVFVMIESKEGVENAAEILAVAGVDGCFLGPYDMTGSYGILGQTGHELIRNAMKQVAEAAQRHQKAAGQHIVTPTEKNVALAFEQGYTFVALGMDSYFLGEGATDALGLVE